MMHDIRHEVRDGKEWRADIRAGKWVGKLLAKKLGVDLSEKANKAKVKTVLDKWFLNGVLDKTEKPDSHGDTREFVIPGDWSEEDDETRGSF